MKILDRLEEVLDEMEKELLAEKRNSFEEAKKKAVEMKINVTVDDVASNMVDIVYRRGLDGITKHVAYSIVGELTARLLKITKEREAE